jgi:hypothetical protein
MLLIVKMMSEMADVMTGKWMLQPVRRCCKGS